MEYHVGKYMGADEVYPVNLVCNLQTNIYSCSLILNTKYFGLTMINGVDWMTTIYLNVNTDFMSFYKSI